MLENAKELYYRKAVDALPTTATTDQIKDMMMFQKELRDLFSEDAKALVDIKMLEKANKLGITYDGRPLSKFCDFKNAWREELPVTMGELKPFFEVLYGQWLVGDLISQMIFNIMKSLELWHVLKSLKDQKSCFYALFSNVLRMRRKVCFQKTDCYHGVTLTISNKEEKLVRKMKGGSYRVKEGMFDATLNIKGWNDPKHMKWHQECRKKKPNENKV